MDTSMSRFCVPILTHRFTLHHVFSTHTDPLQACAQVRVMCECETAFHLLFPPRGAVSALRFNSSGSLLVSGSRDTCVVVWDIISENGLYRLRGHKDMVTDAAFVEASNKLISS